MGPVFEAPLKIYRGTPLNTDEGNNLTAVA